MVVVKRLYSNYPRLGYEVQKGLVVDMPRGDGKATITEAEDGTLTLSERDGKYSVTLKNVQLSEFVEHNILVEIDRAPEANHLVLEDLNIESPETTIRSCYGHNRVSDAVLSGTNDITMTGQIIDDAYIDNSVLQMSSVEKDSLVENSRLLSSTIVNSDVVNSDLDGTMVADSSRVELSHLTSDTVKQAKVGGVSSGYDVLNDTFDDRTFEAGYFVGNGMTAEQKWFDHGYEQVADEDAYVDELVLLTMRGGLPFRVEKNSYELSDDMKDRLEDAMARVSENYKADLVKRAPFLKEVVEPAPLTATEIVKSFAEDEAWREADDFVIDESQFEVKSQQGLQQ